MLNKSNIQNIYEMTTLQEGMFFHALYDSSSSAYFEQTRDRISGKVDAKVFELSWQKLVERHDIFRTVFVNNKNDIPLQIVLKKRQIPFYFEDLRKQSKHSQQICCERYAKTDRENKFDLSKEPLMRFALFQLEDESFEMIWSLHHILLDAWSLNIIQQEFMKTYSALKQGHQVALPRTLPFSRYLQWLKQQDKSKTRLYWQHYLRGYTQAACLPKSGESKGDYQSCTESFFLTKDLSSSLQSYASRQQSTLGLLLQVAWGVLLSALSQRPDVVFALTVSGRPAELEGIENTVGLFINAIPVRVRIAGHTFSSLLQEMKNHDAETKQHHYYSLADLQAESTLKQALFDHILVLENAPDIEPEDEQDFHITQSEHFDHTNYDLTVQITPNEKIGFTFLYNAAVYDAAFMQQMETRLSRLLALLLSNDSCHLFSLDLLPETDKALLLQETTDSLVVVSSFTAEPLAPAFDYWLSTFNLPGGVKFAEYNQVFQQLLNPSSLLHNNDGLSFILLRFEDWLRDMDVTDLAKVCGYLESNFVYLQRAFDKYPPAAGVWFVAIFPPATYLGLPEAITNSLALINNRWRKWLAEKDYVRLIDIEVLAKQYRTVDLFDRRSDNSGHMPFTEAFYAVLGSYLARQWIAKKYPPFKVIALDCDNTLWKGICGEDGINGIEISRPYKLLQKALVEKYEQGFLLVLCSKNNEADAWEVFDTHPDMLLSRQHIVGSRINWSHKSANLKSLATELNLGLDSFVFLDDSGLECSEVMSACPEVLTIQLPENSTDIPDWFSQIWALDRLKVTDEDQLRSALYQAEKQRNDHREQVDSLDDFLSELELEVTMSACQDFQIVRLAQLSQRTNQFNLNGLRLSEKDIQAKMASAQQMCWSIQVDDRFGRYGTVGLLIINLSNSNIEISSFLLSCRVLGRGVEKAIMFGLRQYAEEHSIKNIIADYQLTDRNTPVLNFLQNNGWKLLKDGSYCINRDELPAELDSISWKDTPPEPTPEQHHEFNHVLTREEREGQTTTKVKDKLAISQGWPVLEVNADNLKHRAFLTALAAKQGEALLSKLKPFSSGDEASQQVEFVPASTPIQSTLLGLWEKVLGRSNLGIQDDFFKVGGHSLLAVRLMNRLEQEFECELPIHLLFQNPSVEQFATMLGEYEADDDITSNCIALEKEGLTDTLPLHLLPGYTGSIANLQPLASTLKGKHQVYAFQTPGLNGENKIPRSIEQLAENHLQSLRLVQPTGPYQLAGHSIGGIVAFEMARQLLKDGEVVAFLGILDMHAPAKFVERARSLMNESLLLEELVNEFDALTNYKLDFHLSNSLPYEQQLSDFFDHVKEKNLYFGDLKDLRNRIEVRKNSICNYEKYKVSEKISCPVVLFTSEKSTNDECNTVRLGGWEGYIDSKIRSISVSGEHLTMLAHPYVNNLGQQIMRHLK